jgi:cytochrome c peroxidase
MKYNLYILLINFILIFTACADKNVTENDDNVVPAYPVYSNFPDIIDNPDNPITIDKAILGKNLFFEKLLSKDKTMSCSMCHQPHKAFADNLPLTPTSGGLNDARNVLPIFNVGFYNTYNWDGHSDNLEEMIRADFTAITIFQNDEDTVVKRLLAVPKYRDLYQKAFGTTNIRIEGLTDALAVFIRTIVSGNSKYDRFVRGDVTALNASEKRGMELFMSDRAQCSVCHTPPLFTDLKYHNTAVTTHYFDFGRFYVTGKNSDRGKFRTPTLRNVALTPPYMHNGELETLMEVIEHYNRGGRPFINKSEFIKKRNFTAQEKSDLLAFLRALTDTTFMNDERYVIK